MVVVFDFPHFNIFILIFNIRLTKFSLRLHTPHRAKPCQLDQIWSLVYHFLRPHSGEFSYCCRMATSVVPARITRRAGVFPMESNTKTIAKRARVEPRTQLDMTMIMMFWIIICSTSGLGSDMIVSDNVLKSYTELIKK